MKIKTRTLISVLIGGYPIITEPTMDAYNEWEREYVLLNRYLPVVKKEGATTSELYELNLEARRNFIYREFKGLSVFKGYFEFARTYFERYNNTREHLGEDYARMSSNVVNKVERVVGSVLKSSNDVTELIG